MNLLLTWQVKKFLRIILAIQLTMLGAIALDAIGLGVPILRQFIGFVYLTFVPGALIIRLLRLQRLSNIETLLYTVGLSISFSMFTAFLMNLFYPFIGISSPISTLSIVTTFSFIVCLLSITCYLKDSGAASGQFLQDLNLGSLTPLLLLPFLSVFGTYLLNFYDINLVNLLLIVIISVIGFAILSTSTSFSLAVFVVAISLLFHTSLVSMHLWGWDIHTEYYFANLVLSNSLWDPMISSNLNAVLSVVLLAPIFSCICNMDIVWVFKLVYPFLFSLAPLGLYQAYVKQTGDKIAFLSCYFFMSVFQFYTGMLQLARQEIAELFLALLILTIIDKNINRMAKKFFLIVFSISLIVSHYGLSYIYMFSLVLSWLIIQLKSKKIDSIINLTYVLFFIVFTLAWYMYVSGSSAFSTVVRLGDQIVSSISTEFLSPKTSQALDIVVSTYSPMREVTKVLHMVTQFFIVVGIFAILLKHEKIKFEEEYIAFSLVNFAICLAGIVLPYFSSAFNTSRLYHITLFFLAPFCVIGGIVILETLYMIAGRPWSERSNKISLKILSIFLGIFLLFNSGFVYEVVKDNPTSISLNNTIDNPRFNNQEILGAKWVVNSTTDQSTIYGDEFGRLLLHEFAYGRVRIFWGETTVVPPDAYIYFRSLNVNGKIMKSKIERPYLYINIYNSTFFNNIIVKKSRIYANYGSEIYT